MTFEVSKAERWQFKNEEEHRILDMGIQWLMFCVSVSIEVLVSILQLTFRTTF